MEKIQEQGDRGESIWDLFYGFLFESYLPLFYFALRIYRSYLKILIKNCAVHCLAAGQASQDLLLPLGLCLGCLRSPTALQYLLRGPLQGLPATVWPCCSSLTHSPPLGQVSATAVPHCSLCTASCAPWLQNCYACLGEGRTVLHSSVWSHLSAQCCWHERFSRCSLDGYWGTTVILGKFDERKKLS